MLRGRSREVEFALVAAFSAVLLAATAGVWAARLPHPFDLEWMEGGMLAHAWRLREDLPLYVVEADWAPFIYPPGYPALLAALDPVAPLSMSVGREVSIAGALAAAAALVFRLRRDGGGADLAMGTGAAFLGTYAASGAFMDLVRPDTLSLAFLAWSVALALEERRGAAVASGLLLACAFATKHHAAAYGVPILLGLALRGWRPAAAFTAASLGPALGLLALWHVASDGAILTFLLGVPASHEMVWIRGWAWSPAEWGNGLFLGFGAGSAALVVAAVTQQRAVPTWLAATLPIWAGMLAGWVGTRDALHAHDLRIIPGAIAFWSLGAAPVAAVIWWVGALVDRRRGHGKLPSWPVAMLVAVAATAVLLTGTMRAHDGGYLNVHLPMFWVAALGGGLALQRWREVAAHTPWRFAATAALCVQLGWSWWRLPSDTLVPTQADLRVGREIVAALQSADGPILSPFASWIPTYVGQPPSIHAMAVWDLDREGGPLEDELVVIDQALREHRWAVALVSRQGFRDPLPLCYPVQQTLLEPDDDRFWPRTGWAARPVAIGTPEPCMP